MASNNDNIEGLSDDQLLAELQRRGMGARVAIGPPMSPEEEAEHRARLAEQQASETEAAVDKIQAQLEGIKQTLADKKAEAKQLRADAKQLRANADKGGEG